MGWSLLCKACNGLRPVYRKPFRADCYPENRRFVSQVSIVDTDRKRKLAEDVVDLTVMNRVRSSASLNGIPDPETAEKMRLRMRQEQIELYIKHYEPEQLQALLDFYSTDIGKSILESQCRVADELAAGTRLVSSEIKK